MQEIRFHGRGGQGAVIGSELLAHAFFVEGKYVQAFPAFGVERSGAPVTTFCRVDEHPNHLRNQIYEPEIYESLFNNVVLEVKRRQAMNPTEEPATEEAETEEPVTEEAETEEAETEEPVTEEAETEEPVTEEAETEGAE